MMRAKSSMDAAYCMALRARTNSGMPSGSKPLKLPMVVSVIIMPAALMPKSSPEWISPGINVGRIILPGLSFGGNRSEFLLLSVFFVRVALLVLTIRRSLFGRRLVAMSDSPAAYATLGLNLAVTKVAVFAIAAALAGIAGGLYATVNGTVGSADFDFFSGIIFVLFVTVWSIRAVSGAFLAAVTYVMLTTFWSTGLGLVAGAGIILIGRAASGILGIDRLSTLLPLPWVKRAPVAGDSGTLAGIGTAPMEGEARVAG